MKNIHFLFILSLLLVSINRTMAADPAYIKDLILIDTGIVTKIVTPDITVLENGKQYRLDNIRTPAEYVPTAVDALNKTLLNKKARIYTANGDTAISDRYSLPLAHVIRDDGAWVQGDLVSRGLVWAFASETNRKMMTPLRQIETTARSQKHGFWANPAYRVKTPNSVWNHIDSFQIVEGKILDVAVKKDYAYLNFGQDWKKDFTISIPKKIWPLLSKAKARDFNIDAWKNHMVRIRGWVEYRNGPMIELIYPEQMEFLK